MAAVALEVSTFGNVSCITMLYAYNCHATFAGNRYRSEMYSYRVAVSSNGFRHTRPKAWLEAFHFLLETWRVEIFHGDITLGIEYIRNRGYTLNSRGFSH